jgi:hypothetical protein
MASLLNWNDFNLNKKAKKQDFNTSFVESALSIVCNIHKKYPNRPLQHPLAKYLLDQQCRAIGIPMLEPSGVFGGACFTSYRLTGTCLDLNRPSTGKPCRTPATWAFASIIPGAITGVSYTQVVNQDITMIVSYKINAAAPVQQISGLVYWLKGKFAGSSAQMRWGTTCNEADDVRNVTNLGGFTAQRVDGLPDNCGDASPNYPPDPSPNPSDYRGKFTVTNVDNADNVISNREFDYDFFTVSPVFPINFTVNGASFNFNYEGLSNGVDTGNDDNGNGDLPSTYNRKKPFIPEDYDIEDLGEEEDKKEIEVEKLAWVVVKVTRDPDKRRIMTFDTPDIRHMFAGYFCWTVKKNGIDAQMPTSLINKVENIYKAPDGATGFKAYTTNGAKIRTIIYKEKES